MCRRFLSPARPVTYEKTGKRSFFVDESGVICFTVANQAATVADAPIS